MQHKHRIVIINRRRDTRMPLCYDVSTAIGKYVLRKSLSSKTIAVLFRMIVEPDIITLAKYSSMSSLSIEQDRYYKKYSAIACPSSVS